MKRSEVLPRLESSHDQDRAAGLAWLRESPMLQVAETLVAIKSLCDSPDPLVASIGRFAQVGMTELAIAYRKEAGETCE